MGQAVVTGVGVGSDPPQKLPRGEAVADRSDAKESKGCDTLLPQGGGRRYLAPAVMR